MGVRQIISKLHVVFQSAVLRVVHHAADSEVRHAQVEQRADLRLARRLQHVQRRLHCEGELEVVGTAAAFQLHERQLQRLRVGADSAAVGHVAQEVRHDLAVVVAAVVGLIQRIVAVECGRHGVTAYSFFAYGR